MRLSRKGVEIYVIISEKVLRIGIRDRIDTGLKQHRGFTSWWVGCALESETGLIRD